MQVGGDPNADYAAPGSASQRGPYYAPQEPIFKRPLLDADSGNVSRGSGSQLGIWRNDNKRLRPNNYDSRQLPGGLSTTNAMPPTSQYGTPTSNTGLADAFNGTYTLASSNTPGSRQSSSVSTGFVPQLANTIRAEDMERSLNTADSYATPASSFHSVGSSPYIDPNLATSTLATGYGNTRHILPYSTPWEPPDQLQDDDNLLYAPDAPQTQYRGDYATRITPHVSACPSSFSILNDWRDSQYSYGAAAGSLGTQIDSLSMYGQDASLHLKLQSLAILDNLATQIILNLAKPSLAEIMQLTSGENSEESQAYLTRKNLFDQTRKVYSRDTAFIDAVAIQLFTQAQQDVIRKANKATFISSILEGHDVSFFDLNEYFLEIFVPVGQRLLKWQGGVFLELKTQVYISAVLNSDGSVLPLLDELFPLDLEDRITARHPDAPNFAPSEQDFLDRARARKQYLQAEPPDDALTTLPRKYEWQDFLREFASCVCKNVDTILNPSNRSQPGLAIPQSQADLNFIRRAGKRQSSATAAGLGINPFLATTDTQDVNASSYSDPRTSRPSNVATLTDSSATSPQPTAAKPRAKAAKPSGQISTQRQLWKQEEEDALMAGLAEVKGPHWSQVLSLYGRGGSISEVLKDRNQIQLKDKARNLKLWHLKMGNEVPECLQGVTGELRKRGGARVRAALETADSEYANAGGLESSRYGRGGT